jgi:NhaA family Na+:H+ antiporter
MREQNNDTPRGTTYDAPLEKAFDRIVTPFEEFIHNEAASGLLVMACAAIALIIANSPLHTLYEDMLHAPIGITIGGWSISKSIHHWINDALMAMFFFVVGLEIKREILVGELSEARQAVLPIIAAVGGMVVPATIFAAFNYGTDTIDGWGIPMATDIAFAVGALVLLGKRIPPALVTFLVALAIVDDLGAVAVIAVFYTENLDMTALAAAVFLFGGLWMLNLLGMRRPLPYFVLGGLLWFAILASGVHATLAGLLTALAIPARPKYDPKFFSEKLHHLMAQFDASHLPGMSIIHNQKQRALLQTMENSVHHVETPLQRLEHDLHIPVSFGVIPIFALANAGIPIEWGAAAESLSHPVTLGVGLGLIVGKLIGVAGASWLAVRLGIAKLPADITMQHIVGVGLLAGIGFTMSIFIADLAYTRTPEYLLLAKTGILAGSLVSGIAGYLWLRRLAPAS